jgi:hypothetical protein
MPSDATPVPRTGLTLLAVAGALALIGRLMPVSVAQYSRHTDTYYLWEGNNVYVLAVDLAVLVALIAAVAAGRRPAGWLLWTFVVFTLLLSLAAVIYTLGASQSGHSYPLGVLLLTVECVLRIIAAVRLFRVRRAAQPVNA